MPITRARKAVTSSDIMKMRRMKRGLAGATAGVKRKKRRSKPGSPFAKRNLKTLFKSAIGTFPARRHR